MIWTTWRQHRGEASVGALILAALVAGLAVVGSTVRDRTRALGLPKCTNAGGDCSKALDALHRDFHSIPPFTGALIAVPLLAGMFWAAPLVSREYESGTHRLAWTQSVSPVRWITIKITLIFAVIAGAALAVGLLATWTLDPLTPAFGGRYNSTWYDIQGVVPVACMLFALSVGVAASAVIRRTIPAMAVTLVGYAAARIPIHWIRGRFWPATSRTYTTSFSTLLQNPTGPLRGNFPSTANGWVQTITITDPSGNAVPPEGGNLDVLSNYCPGLKTGSPPGQVTQHTGTPTGTLHPSLGPSSVPAAPPPSAADLTACKPKVQNLSLHEKIRYHPASHFWLIQTVETAIFLGLAALLVSAAILAVTRYRPT